MSTAEIALNTARPERGGELIMAASPKYKVYRGKEYIGCVKDATVLFDIAELAHIARFPRPAHASR
jgi:hypothetical protein